MRISDKSWEKARRVARERGTTITALLEGYLGSLTTTSKLKPSQVRKTAPTNIEKAAGRPVPRPPGRPAPPPRKVKANPADCLHPEKSRKTILNKTFCSKCGTELK